MDKYMYNCMYIFSFCYSLLGNRWNCFSVLFGLTRERVKRRLILKSAWTAQHYVTGNMLPVSCWWASLV